MSGIDGKFGVVNFDSYSHEPGEGDRIYISRKTKKFMSMLSCDGKLKIIQFNGGPKLKVAIDDSMGFLEYRFEKSDS